jgi:hypothetical protein
MNNSIFWDATPCGCCKNRRFGGMYLLHHQSDKNRRARNNVSRNYQPKPHDVTSQNDILHSHRCGKPRILYENLNSSVVFLIIHKNLISLYPVKRFSSFPILMDRRPDEADFVGFPQSCDALTNRSVRRRTDIHSSGIVLTHPRFQCPIYSISGDFWWILQRWDLWYGWMMGNWWAISVIKRKERRK